MTGSFGGNCWVPLIVCCAQARGTLLLMTLTELWTHWHLLIAYYYLNACLLPVLGACCCWRKAWNASYFRHFWHRRLGATTIAGGGGGGAYFLEVSRQLQLTEWWRRSGRAAAATLCQQFVFLVSLFFLHLPLAFFAFFFFISPSPLLLDLRHR